MTFGSPQWFWALLVIPALVGLFLRSEQRAAAKLREFVSPKLLPQLSATVNRGRRAVRFGFLLLALALATVSLARPQVGYIYQDVKRKGLDLLFAVDTSRSMLSNDVQPNRLERVKLAAQDLVNQLQGDRVGLVAFAGRAFLEAPLTIDYDAAVESINDLDTKTIPEGGTNISEAINLAVRTFGKSAAGNRALIIFTDGEELNGDAVKAAKAAADAGVKIFTIGVGTPQGSLIPLASGDGGAAFVKDSAGQVVKSKLDEKRLREIAEATGGFYLHLESGPQTMAQLYSQGLANMKAAEIDARLSRTPIERYEWPLGAALLALTMSILMRERKRARARSRLQRWPKAFVPATALLFVFAQASFGAATTGLNLYRDGNYNDAYKSFQQDLQSHPDSSQKERIEFDAGAAAFKMGDYNKALQSFSDSLLSPDKKIQENSHFNLGRTLEERADVDQGNDKALKDLTDAASHYESTLQLNPKNEAARANLEEVRKKIERLKQHPKSTPTPPPQQQKQQQKKDQQQQQGGGEQNQDQQQQQSQSDSGGQDQKQQQQNQQQSSQSKSDQQQQQQMAKNEPEKDRQQPKPGESPSPSPSQDGEQQKEGNQQSPSPGQGENKSGRATPSPTAGRQDRQSQAKQEQPEESPSPGGEDQMPSPSPGEGQGEGDRGATPSPTASGSPQKKLAGEIKGANGEQQPDSQEQAQQFADAEPETGQLTEKQAEALLRSMKDEERRVQLDERKVRRHVYNDW
ncbi:MAG TPA: VWA domain-containing protein [Chthoniobacterales bacterium]|jgi:Ca-activated chloride channel family protein|nr:VWA domain-containing protein [Chthoniobacterales bacterium]